MGSIPVSPLLARGHKQNSCSLIFFDGSVVAEDARLRGRKGVMRYSHHNAKTVFVENGFLCTLRSSNEIVTLRTLFLEASSDSSREDAA